MTWEVRKEMVNGRCIGFVVAKDGELLPGEAIVYLNRDTANRAADVLNERFERGDSGL